MHDMHEITHSMDQKHGLEPSERLKTRNATTLSEPLDNTLDAIVVVFHFPPKSLLKR